MDFDVTGIKERIKNLCKENNISVNKLENDLGFATGYISKLDKSTPNAKNIAVISRYFGVSVDYLMFGKKVIIEKADTDTQLILMEKRMKEYALKLSELSDTDKEFVMQMIDKLSVSNK